ncbi:hypothetical protein JQ543_12350 [Bradyrhizobium diazoefficiens]|nr:hypothetical protein [Bradyrhizobium diazoefficiens]MBR0848534.1 hypothetical protein [Bradyrhizobium diazoefficiens]
MSKSVLVGLFCSATMLAGLAGSAQAEIIGRYQCNIVGPAVPEPLGDRNGHSLLNYPYSCVGVEGLLKDAVVTAFSAAEWDGPKTTSIAALGVHRAPGGAAIAQVLEGTQSIIMKDGKPVGTEGSGKTLFKFASGTLAALAGKTVNFNSKSTGLNRFEILFTD